MVHIKQSRSWNNYVIVAIYITIAITSPIECDDFTFQCGEMWSHMDTQAGNSFEHMFMRVDVVPPLWHSGIKLGMGSSNERRRYNVMSPLTGWVHTQNDSCRLTRTNTESVTLNEDTTDVLNWYLPVHVGWWGCEVSCGGHHRPRGKTTTGSAQGGAVFDIAQILAYLVHTMSRSQLYLGFGHFGWLLSFFDQ